MFNFETYSKGFVLRILSRCTIISDMFTETIDTRLILNKNLDWFFSFEFDSFAGWDFSSEIMNHFSLGLRIFGRIKS